MDACRFESCLGRVNENEPIGNVKWIDNYHLDPELLEINVPLCDNKKCIKEAVLWFKLLCCDKNVYLFCQNHVNKMLSDLNRHQPVTCDECGTGIANLDFVTVPRPLDSLDA